MTQKLVTETISSPISMMMMMMMTTQMCHSVYSEIASDMEALV
jgi:hypothetical protein